MTGIGSDMNTEINWPALESELRETMGTGVRIRSDESALRSATRDFSWVSPIIANSIPRQHPYAVVTVTTVEDVRRVARFAHQHRMPLIPRGKGTSNYGQTIPLARGIIVDFSRMSGQMTLHDDGILDVLAGTSWQEMMNFLDGSGRELAMYPTTLNSTAAGYIGGGAGGPGSIENGFNHEGFVRRITLIPVTEAAEPVTIEHPEAAAHVHSFGTTGLMVRVGLQTVPAREWTGLFASVPDLETGAVAALEILELTPPPQLLAVTEPELAALFPEDPGLQPERTNLRAVVTVDQIPVVTDILARHGGQINDIRADSTRFLATLINNHTTVRAKTKRPELFHVLVRGNAIVGKRSLVAEAFPGAVVQLEGIRDQVPCLQARILAPHITDEALLAGMQQLREVGLDVDSPHSWVVHDALPPRWVAAARFDPRGLLNPGKLPPV